MIDLFNYIDTNSIQPVLQYYSLTMSDRVKADQRFAILAEIFAGNVRLQGMEGEQRKLMEKINELELARLLEVIDELQDEFEKQVAVWPGFNVMLAVLIFHYASVMMLSRHVARVNGGMGVDAWEANLRKQVKHWFDVDYKHLRDWKQGEQQTPSSDDKNAARAPLYGGNIRGIYFKLIELGYSMSQGWVSEYITKGDKSTCKSCREAAGYYLPGQGPMPGQVCKGRARCRCKRVLKYDPARYNLLILKPDFTNWDWSMGGV